MEVSDYDVVLTILNSKKPEVLLKSNQHLLPVVLKQFINNKLIDSSKKIFKTFSIDFETRFRILWSLNVDVQDLGFQMFLPDKPGGTNVIISLLGSMLTEIELDHKKSFSKLADYYGFDMDRLADPVALDIVQNKKMAQGNIFDSDVDFIYIIETKLIENLKKDSDWKFVELLTNVMPGFLDLGYERLKDILVLKLDDIDSIHITNVLVKCGIESRKKLQKYGFIVHKINSLQTLAVARSMGLTDDGLMLNKNDETRIKSLTPWIAIGEVSQCSLKKGDKIEIFKLKRINVIPFVSVFDTILGVVQDVELIDGLYGQEPVVKVQLDDNKSTTLYVSEGCRLSFALSTKYVFEDEWAWDNDVLSGQSESLTSIIDENDTYVLVFLR